MRQKQRLFPSKYNFTKMLNAKTCMELTENIMIYFPEFTSYRDYFKLYTLTDQSFQNLNIPVNIFISADDPVIPQDDYELLHESGFLKIAREKYGGHCGFIDLFPYKRWYNEIISDLVTQGNPCS